MTGGAGMHTIGESGEVAMKPKTIFLLATAVFILGDNLSGQEKKSFLEPADILKIMTESKTAYVVNSLDKLKPEEARNLAGLLFSPGCAPINNPRVEWTGGQATVQEYQFKSKAVELVRKAETSFSEKKYEKARKIYEQALRADPDHYLAIAYIGDCYLFSGQVEKALSEYDKAILKNPHDHRLFFFRGNALMRLGKVEDARQCYIHALMLRPRYSYVLKVVNLPQSPLSMNVRESIFQPPVLVRKEGTGVAIYFDADKTGAHWLAYANAKAVWLGEPSHRQKMIGKTDPGWSTTEERECLANLMAVYVTSLNEKTIHPEPDLEIVKQIFDNNDVEPFLLYEVYTRICSWGMLMMPDETQKKVEQYIQKYMIIPRQ